MFLPFDTHPKFEFHLIGVSYKKTALEVREKFCVPNDKVAHLYELVKNSGINDFFLLSTCNRTELYAFTKNPDELAKSWKSCLQDVDDTLYQEHVYHIKNHEAVTHLFHVTGGLDSQILGDFEILGQVKKALTIAKNMGTASGPISRLVQYAISASKKIKTETQLSSGASSVASAAVFYLQQNISDLATKKVLLIGTGKIGRVTCSNLLKQVPSKNITLINRTEENAQKIAQEFQIQTAPFTQLNDFIASHDIIIVATDAPQPIIDATTLQPYPIKEKILLDLSVPRNIASEVADIEGIQLINVDQLEDLKNHALLSRETNIPKAKQFIHHFVLEYYTWLHMTPIYPLIQNLSKTIQNIDVQETTEKLKTAGIIHKNQETKDAAEIFKICISHIKANYHKPEIGIDPIMSLFDKKEEITVS